jgi:betaine reductase
VIGFGNKEVTCMLQLKGKLVLALGERDGVPAPALRTCAESAGATVIYDVTQCFV